MRRTRYADGVISKDISRRTSSISSSGGSSEMLVSRTPRFEPSQQCHPSRKRRRMNVVEDLQKMSLRTTISSTGSNRSVQYAGDDYSKASSAATGGNMGDESSLEEHSVADESFVCGQHTNNNLSFNTYENGGQNNMKMETARAINNGYNNPANQFIQQTTSPGNTMAQQQQQQQQQQQYQYQTAHHSSQQQQPATEELRHKQSYYKDNNRSQQHMVTMDDFHFDDTKTYEYSLVASKNQNNNKHRNFFSNIGEQIGNIRRSNSFDGVYNIPPFTDRNNNSNNNANMKLKSNNTADDTNDEEMSDS